MNTILFGNGFNLATGAFPKWTDLIKDAGFESRKRDKSVMPYPLRFELAFQKVESRKGRRTKIFGNCFPGVLGLANRFPPKSDMKSKKMGVGTGVR